MALQGLEKLASMYGSTRSDNKEPFPLAMYLELYNKASIECRMDHMEGARVLKSWLGPINMPLFAHFYEVPQLLRTYEFVELAKILAPMEFGVDNWLEVLATTEGCMYCTLVAEVA